MKAGYPPIIIRVENRLAYYNALDKAHTTEDYEGFTELVEKEVEASLDLYLSALLDVAGNIVMQTNKLIDLFEADEYWQDSYTK